MAKRKVKNTGVNIKQKTFVDEYVKNGFQGAAAARKAGYAERTARITASKLLSQANVQDYLSKRIKAVLGNTDALSVKLIDALKTVAFGNITDVVTWNEDGSVNPIASKELPRSATFGVSEISSKANHDKDGSITDYDFKIKQADKLKAIDMLAKFVKLYEDNKPAEDEEVTPIEQLSKQERTNKLLEFQERLSKLGNHEV